VVRKIKGRVQKDREKYKKIDNECGFKGRGVDRRSSFQILNKSMKVLSFF